jgi:HEAT repeat protein
MSAANALGAVGSASVAAVPALIGRLEIPAEDGFARGDVAHALGEIGPAAKSALPVLKEAVGKRRVGAAAEEAILKIEGKPVPSYH